VTLTTVLSRPGAVKAVTSITLEVEGVEDTTIMLHIVIVIVTVAVVVAIAVAVTVTVIVAIAVVQTATLKP
jgi:hypothetical protein